MSNRVFPYALDEDDTLDLEGQVWANPGNPLPGAANNTSIPTPGKSPVLPSNTLDLSEEGEEKEGAATVAPPGARVETNPAIIPEVRPGNGSRVWPGEAPDYGEERGQQMPVSETNGPGSGSAPHYMASCKEANRFPDEVWILSASGPISKCKVLKTQDQRIDGFQPYSSYPGHGLFFPYSKTARVAFHMGRVAFPLDMIFLRRIHNELDPIEAANENWIRPRLAKTASALESAVSSGSFHIRLGSYDDGIVDVKLHVSSERNVTAELSAGDFGLIPLEGRNSVEMASGILRYAGSGRVRRSLRASRWLSDLADFSPITIETLNAHLYRNPLDQSVKTRVASILRSQLHPWLEATSNGFAADAASYQVTAIARNVQPNDQEIYSAPGVDSVAEFLGGISLKAGILPSSVLEVVVG